MLSKNRVNFILSLQKKKVREEEKLFIIEGDKLVKEFLSAGIYFKSLVAKPEFIGTLSVKERNFADEIVPVSYEELKKVSTLKTPHNAIAIVKMPDLIQDMNPDPHELSVALDCIQDPGNLGTIIRAAAWFGIKKVYCSPDSVDAFNPKVIQSTMGAILHVKVYYTEISGLLLAASENNMTIYGTVMEGESIYTSDLGNNGIILMGNESKGISTDLLPLITRRLTIPGHSEKRAGIDSLNVGMAASIVFSEFARRRK